MIFALSPLHLFVQSFWKNYIIAFIKNELQIFLDLAMKI